MNKLFVGLLCLVAAATLAAAGAGAETLGEALALAYRNNPTLLAQRAALRATDEQVPQALAGWRPTVTATGELGKKLVDSKSGFFTSEETRTPESYALTLSQPIYRGGRTVAATRQAKNLVLADRARLAEVEQDVLLQAATAYMDVWRDRAIVDLALSNERRLERTVQAARDRFEVGVVTLTDVAQAEARLSSGIAERIRAQGDLAGVRAAFGVLLPEVSLDAELRRAEDQSSKGSLSESASISARLTIPLYQAGGEYSRVRAARAVAAQRRLEIERSRRSVIENVTRTWETLQTTRAQITALGDAVDAAEIAFEGVEQEAAVGTRTTLDVLDAEQELFDAKVDLVLAQRDEVVASYALAAAIGRLSARTLGLRVDIYDELRHYEAVRGKLWGLGSGD
ncbi:MAG: TolC family protein [Proteobacteria bacterium]|nr:TolC family protein [Pseudomonadota bacterium]